METIETGAGSVDNLTSEEFQEYLAATDGARLIDVRTPFEFQMGHIPNADLIDISDPTFPERIQELDRDTPYFLYCRSGSRSFHAAAFMVELGFSRIFNLRDGIIAWTGDVVQE